MPPCPVDCIEMVDPPAPVAPWSPADADLARERHRRRGIRLERIARADRERLAHEAQAKLDELRGQPSAAATERKRAVIAAAIERARQRREAAR